MDGPADKLTVAPAALTGKFDDPEMKKFLKNAIQGNGATCDPRRRIKKVHQSKTQQTRRVAPAARPCRRSQVRSPFAAYGILVGAVLALSLTPARGADAPGTGAANLKDADLQILTVFAAKCAACHGPELEKPKKGFGYCLDLKRMAANPKLVVPLNPEKSKLYTTIDSDDMPPSPDDDGVPLTKAEKETVLAALKTWIAAGAPATDGGAAAPAPAASFTRRTLTLAGKFHPLIAHFPIALLVAAAVAELVWLRTRQSWLTGVVRFCTLFGAAGAVLTATLGWVDAYHLFPADSVLIVTWGRVITAVVLTLAAATGEFFWLRTRPILIRLCVLFGWFAILAVAASLLSWHDAIRYPTAAPDLTLLTHRWLGTAGALWAIPVLLLSERGFKRRLGNPQAGDPRPWFSLMLFAGVGLIGLAAHFGGGLVYGTDYLNW
jgi:uncharacterized membrane protein